MALEPWSMGAVELATAIRTKQLSSRMRDEFLFDAGRIVEDACGTLTPIAPR